MAQQKPIYDIAQLRDTLEHIPMAVAVFDPEMRYLLANRQWFTQYHLGQRDIIGQSHYDLFPEIADDWRSIHQRVLKGEIHRSEDTPFPRNDGGMDWVRWEMRPWFRDDGETGGLLMYSEMISERKRTEDLLRQVIDAQRLALQEQAAPIVPVYEGVLVLPLIGGIDAARAREITRALLASVSEHKAQVVVIDVSGVTAIDAEVTNALDRAVQAVRLKGAQAIIAGISDVLAETIIDLGIDWSSIDTPRDLPTGVALALRKLNLHITRQL